MKSMTFGTVPSFEEFKAAFDKECPHFVYELDLNASDARMFEATGIEVRSWHYGVQSLYELVSVLATIGNGYYSRRRGPRTEEQVEWAGSFASGILGTLGFEWI